MGKALILLISIIIELFSAICKQFAKLLLKKKNDKEIMDRATKKQIVAASSQWYKQVVELNESIKWYKDILDGGHSECYLYVDSKSKFDNAKPHETIEQFLIMHRERIVQDREFIRRNYDLNEEYQEKLQLLSSCITQQKCDLLEISYKEYIEIERELVEATKLRIIDSYGVTCKVIYTSTHGRNRYVKEFYYDDFDIDEEYRKIDRKREKHCAETTRRRTERSKVTPSLRYDIMKRDGFRCCICGSSADDGIELEVDHIIPISKGGTSKAENLQTLCRTCNRGKAAKY